MNIRETLLRYRETWGGLERFDRDGQLEALEDFDALLKDYPECLLRQHVPGHLTGAALVTDGNLSRVLLTLHRKLGIWLQLGGHADGEADLSSVAMREAREESGLIDLHFLRYGKLFGTPEDAPLPFDLDVHAIPARKEDPAHFHYDVRFVVVAGDPEKIAISEESLDLRWFTLEDAFELTHEPSMRRQFQKLAYLRETLCR